MKKTLLFRPGVGIKSPKRWRRIFEPYSRRSLGSILKYVPKGATKKKVKKASHMGEFILIMGLIWATLFFCSCVTGEKHMAGPGSSLSDASRNLAYDIKSKYNFSMKNIQVSPNGFWERNTQINLPFSTILCDTLSAELSGLGANITLQETGEAPLKIIGAYQKAGDDMLITARLRQMGASSSTDLAFAQERIPMSHMDPLWLQPCFSRMARTLVRLLEEDYSGITTLKIKTGSFVPACPSQPQLTLGPEFKKYMTDALVSSFMFAVPGTALASAVLKGDYVQMGDKMVFHAAIVDEKSGGSLAGAAFETPVKDIPKSLLTPRIQSVESLAQTISAQLIDTYKTKGLSGPRPSLIYIGKNSFHDPSNKSMVPLGIHLADAFRKAFSNTCLFTVTNNPSMATDLILSGTVRKSGKGLMVTAGIEQIQPALPGQSSKTLAFEQGSLGHAYCRDNWFDMTLNGKTDFLMHRLETKSLAFLPAGKRPEIVINRFKYQNSKQYSGFSDYLAGYMLDYFCTSRYFSPVRNVEKRLVAAKTRGVRSIVPTGKTGATVAVLARSDYYVDGSFWPLASGDIEIKASLCSVKGTVLASEHIRVNQDNIDPAWLESSQGSGFSQNLNALSREDSKLVVELLTQKGRNNLSFAKGEEINFILKANKNVFLKLYTIDADNRIFRIYPNAFTPDQPMIRAGAVTFIPDNNYAADFSFQVRGKTGNEMVFAFASDKPLPNLPGSSDTGFHGMRQVSLGVEDIKQWFSDYALKRGISLSWDVLPVRTY